MRAESALGPPDFSDSTDPDECLRSPHNSSFTHVPKSMSLDLCRWGRGPDIVLIPLRASGPGHGDTVRSAQLRSYRRRYRGCVILRDLHGQWSHQAQHSRSERR